MANKEQKRSKPEEAKDRDKADEGHEAVSEDEAEAAAPARPASAQERRARMREQRKAAAPVARAHDDHAHDDHGHGHDHDEDEIDYTNDSSWWVPHAVLGTIVLVGVLGFFGAFNSVAAKLGYGGMSGLAAATTTTATPSSKPVENKAPPPPPRPGPQDQQPQPPREMFGAKHLLVMYKGGMRAPENVTRTKEEAKVRAAEAYKKAKAGTKFEDLVKEYSDEPGAGQRGGDLGMFPKGRMVPAFQEGLEKTKVGEVSDLVETPFGYHVILRTK